MLCTHSIRGYRPGDWPRVAAFLAMHWAPRHALLNPELFEWQYRGFLAEQDADDRPPALLIERGDEILGFLGLIHGTYQLAGHDRPVPGAALATWVVHTRYRHVGLGIQLLDEAERRWPVLVCLGVNAVAGACYRRRGYQEIPALARYVAPLSAASYVHLCERPAEFPALSDWAATARQGDPLPPSPVSPADLADAWQRSTRAAGEWTVQGLHRTERFWHVRYRRSVGYEYLAWRRSAGGPVVIARLEQIRPTSGRVLRLIELIPANPRAWAGDAADDELAALVCNVLAWAADEFCVAADFQTTPGLLAATLARTPLRAQASPPSLDPSTSLAPVFQPVSFDKPPINVFWRAPDASQTAPWYFPKSDGDMDRPYAV
jgi:ribosomal protein S18 acetylase RimI-like enzyme